MISLDMKSDINKSSSSPLNLSTSKGKNSTSFSELLIGASERKDAKFIQNGSLILSLDSAEKVTKETKGIVKKDTLISLLKNEENLPSDTKTQPLELNPKLTTTLSTKEVKLLVADAKNYLKEKIENSDGYKKSQIKELPNTLKGLVEVAKKFGIDISKITLQEVKAHAEVKNEFIKDEKKVATPELKETAHDKGVKAATPELKEAVQEKGVKVATPELKEAVQEKGVKVATQEPKEIVQDKKIQALHVQEKDKSIPPSQFGQLKETKETPLFKAQSVVEHTTTEQLVQVKANTSSGVVQKTPKDKADETLKLLLRGEKPSISNPGLTTDFSVAAAKVIAPTAVSDASQSLEKLLHGDSSPVESSNPSTKTETFTTHKADSFEVKLNEAKQMIKYLSGDVKTAIEDYKSPFTRVKIQLNPQRLGEVDLTIVQRGKNLHVNISSNNTAINTLSMNANELKIQLNNSGINNATLNFSNSSQNGENAQQQQQHNHQNEQQAHEEYRYFENESTNEEVLSSLEIIVPHYA